MTVGASTPATVGWKYASSSWSPTKYQGALATSGVTLGFASSSRGALTKRPMKSMRMLIIAAAKNSIESRCGHVMTVSSGSFWTRTTASCLTSARSRYGLAAIGTRCLSISVVRRSGGAAGSVLRRSGAAGVAPSLGAAGSWLRSRGSVISLCSGPYSGPLMPPSFRMRQKWMARKMAATRGIRMTCRT